MALMPAMTVAAPEPRGLRYGLLTAANGPLMLEAHGGGGGVQYEPVSCGRARTYPVECDDTPAEKTFDTNDTTIVAEPFAVYSSLTCGTVGTSAAQVEEKVRRRLANGEQTEVEAELAELLAADSDALVSFDAGDITYVVAELEQWLYGTQRYGNVGYLHAPILAAAHAVSASLVYEDRRVPGLLTTRMGTIWVFGAGYPDDGTVYITGQVTVWRGDVTVAPPEQTLNRATNQWYGLAEREYAVAWDCLAARTTFNPDTLS